MIQSNSHRIVLCAFSLFATVATASAYDKLIDSPMYQLPHLPTPKVIKVFPEGIKALWMKALARPDADEKCRAAAAITLAARRKYPGLDTTIPHLVAELDRAEQAPAVRLAVADALIALHAEDAAPSLLRQAQAGNSELRELIEPALAKWNYRPAREIWLARLADPAATPRTLLLTMRNLKEVKEGQAADRLRDLALSQRVAGPIRVEAARALAVLRTEGLEKDAEGLIGGTLVNRLIAASLLVEHRGKTTIELLKRLAKDPEPSVATLAVARLIQIDLPAVVEMLGDLLKRSDANLRSQAVAVLLAVPAEKHIVLLADQLNDADPEVRIQAREAMHTLADKQEWHRQVIDQGTRILSKTDWRGLEQAAILLTELNHKDAGGRFVELLTFNRPEVFVAAAWGLRKLNDPARLAGVRNYVKAELPRLRAGQRLPIRRDIIEDAPFDHQLSQLNQFLGQQKDSDAEGLLRQFLEKRADRLLPECRAAAVWALGMIHEGKAPDDLPPILVGRLNDEQSIPPEAEQVRYMSAITLGRMRAESARMSLEAKVPFAYPSNSAIHNACGWAVAQIKNETWPAPKNAEVVDRDWFLLPGK